MRIKTKVDELVNKYNTICPFELADQLNIIVRHLPLGSLKGLYQLILDDKFIILNDNLTSTQKPLILAHELGHAVLHTHDNIIAFKRHTLFSHSKLETEADTFASELLLYDFNISDYEGYTTQQIAACLQLPTHLVQLKLKSLGYF